MSDAFEPSTVSEDDNVVPMRVVVGDLKKTQNFFLAIIAGLVCSVTAAIAWGLITSLTRYQISWMAIGAGVVVGIGVRIFGKGVTIKFGILGAVLSLFSCLLGNFLADVMMYASENHFSTVNILLNIDYTAVPDLMMSTFQPMDLLFYGIALYVGFKASYQKLAEAEAAAVSQS